MKSKIIIGNLEHRDSDSAKRTYLQKEVSNFLKKHQIKRIVVLDNKREWEPHFSIRSINIMRVPKQINLCDYIKILEKNLCIAHGIPNFLYSKVGSFIKELYNDNEVFEKENDKNWIDEKSKNITLENLYDKIAEVTNNLDNDKDQKEKEYLNLILNHLCIYKRRSSIETMIPCNKKGNSIDFIWNSSDFLVFDTRGCLFSTNAFVWGVIIDTFCKANERPNNLMFFLEDFCFADSENEINMSDLLIEAMSKGATFFSLSMTTSCLPKKLIDCSDVTIYK